MRKLLVVKDEVEVVQTLANEIQKCAVEAIERAGIFRVGLSGGSMVSYLSIAIDEIECDTTKWRFFFCDERYVPETNADSTYGAYKNGLIARGSIRLDQFVRVNTKLSLEEAAKDYEEKILKEYQLEYGSVPDLDLLLLGMGPDGHTCSLFPNHPLLNEKDRLVAAIKDSPKPPPQRVTMTYALLNGARCCIMAMCGESKAEMVKRVFVDKDMSLPAARIDPSAGTFIAIFDETAGKHIKQ